MPRYRYKAYGPEGALENGIVSAASRAVAIGSLSDRGRLLVEIDEVKDGTEVPWWQRQIGSPRISVSRLALFTRELAGLVKAELPADEALRVVTLQPMIPVRLRSVAASLMSGVREGESLSQALAAQGSAFPAYYTRLIEAGEASGDLGTVLDSLAGFLERQAETRSKLAGSLVYPVILIVVAMGALLVITSALIPAILPIFEDAGTSPPRTIALLAAAGDALSHYWPIVVVSGLGLLAGAALLFELGRIRQAVDRWLLKLPAFGRLIAENQSARLSRTLAMQLRGGVPLPDAVRGAAGVLGNRTFADAARQAERDLGAGGSLTLSLARTGIFPDLFLRLSRIGEETGQLISMHERIASIYEAMVARRVATLTGLVTPVLTVVIGVFIGGLILSVMDAILSINALAVP